MGIVDEFLRDAKPTDLFELIKRDMEVASLKEDYSKEYLLDTGLVSPEEYESIPTGTIRRDAYRHMQDAAYLLPKIVGSV